MHLKRCIHGDIKPENFILKQKEGTDNKLKLIDFGLSQYLPVEQTHVYGVPEGTFSYMAPEIKFISMLQYLDKLPACAPYSFSSDIYSLGEMFNKDLHLKSTQIPIVKNMMSYFSGQRPTLDEVIEVLQKAYEEQRVIKHQLASFDNQSTIEALYSHLPVQDQTPKKRMIALYKLVMEYSRDSDSDSKSAQGYTNLAVQLLEKDSSIINGFIYEYTENQTVYGMTALMVAAEQGNRLMTQVLCEQGADKHQSNTKNQTAIILALENRQLGVFEYLTQDLDPTSELSKELLLIAAEYGYSEILRFLIDKKQVDPTVQAFNKNNVLTLTLMHHASDIETLKYLIPLFSENFIKSYSIHQIKHLLKANLIEVLKMLTPYFSAQLRQEACSIVVRGGGNLVVLQCLLEPILRGQIESQSLDKDKLFTEALYGPPGYNSATIEYLLADYIKIEDIKPKITPRMYLLCVQYGYSTLVETLYPQFVDQSQEAFLKAAEVGNMSMLLFFINKPGVNIDHQQSKDTALMFAAQSGHHAIVSFLLKKNANPKLKNYWFKTAFALAVDNNHFEVVDLLLTPALCPVQKHMALHVALQKGYFEVAWLIILSALSFDKSILNQANDIHENPVMALRAAIQEGNLSVVQYLMESNSLEPQAKEGVLKHSQDSGFRQGFEFENQLTMASAFGHNHIIKYFLSIGIAIDSLNKKRETALEVATQYGRFDTVQYILSVWPSDTLEALNKKNEAIERTFIKAIKNKQLAVLNVLIDHQMNAGIAINLFYLLIEAVTQGQVNIFERLLSLAQQDNIDINNLPSFPNGILSFALDNTVCYEIITMLISAQAEINEAVLIQAARKNCIDIFYALQKNNANIKISLSPEIIKNIFNTALRGQAGNIVIFLLTNPSLFPLSAKDKKAALEAISAEPDSDYQEIIALLKDFHISLDEDTPTPEKIDTRDNDAVTTLQEAEPQLVPPKLESSKLLNSTESSNDENIILLKTPEPLLQAAKRTLEMPSEMSLAIPKEIPPPICAGVPKLKKAKVPKTPVNWEKTLIIFAIILLLTTSLTVAIVIGGPTGLLIGECAIGTLSGITAITVISLLMQYLKAP